VADDIIRSVVSAADREEAIEELFFALYPRLARTAFALVGDWHVAEQIAQEAFLRLWRRWPWLRDQQAAPAYLHRTVVNLARLSLRRLAVERRALARDAGERAVALADDGGDLAGDLALRRAVEALPYRKRACVVLRYLEGLSEAETASALGISVGTVKSQTHKALRQLRDVLGEPAGSAKKGSAT
jgi:RNA polymerase sigma-70 factor (sigma-E family)